MLCAIGLVRSLVTVRKEFDLRKTGLLMCISMTNLNLSEFGDALQFHGQKGASIET